MSTHRTREDRGASAVEYGLLLAGIAALLAGLIWAVGQASGQRLSDDCGTIGSHIETAIGNTGGGSCGP